MSADAMPDVLTLAVMSLYAEWVSDHETVEGVAAGATLHRSGPVVIPQTEAAT